MVTLTLTMDFGTEDFSQNNYLNCYWLPYVDPSIKNKYAYVPGSVLCNNLRNYGHNVNDNGFKYYETKLNLSSR